MDNNHHLLTNLVLSGTSTQLFEGLTQACCSTGSKGSACAALPESQGFQPWQGQGALVPVAHLEEATPDWFPVGHMGASAAASGLLQWRLAPSRQRYCLKETCLYFVFTACSLCSESQNISVNVRRQRGLHLSQHGLKQPVNYWLKTEHHLSQLPCLKMSNCF